MKPRKNRRTGQLLPDRPKTAAELKKRHRKKPPSDDRSKLTPRPVGVQYGTKKSPALMAKILAGLRAGWSTTKAANDAGVVRETALLWRANDPVFAAAWKEAYEAGTDTFVDEAARRGREGFNERPLVDREGKTLAVVKDYSDALLTINLKARRPDEYAVERHEHYGKGGRPLETQTLTKEEALARAKELGLPTTVFEK